MENRVLTIDTGLVTYRINDAIDVTFNPTDSAFVERLYNTFGELDKKQEEFKAEAANADKGEVFEIAKKRDREMRDMVDAALGVPVCDALFGTMNVYAFSNGLPLWANLLFAIVDEIDSTVMEEQKKMKPRIDKYAKKYHR